MLSSVLRSAREMNILIMRAFVNLRELLATHKDLARKIETLEATQKDHAALFSVVIEDIQNLATHVSKEFKQLKSPRRRKARRSEVIQSALCVVRSAALSILPLALRGSGASRSPIAISPATNASTALP